MSIVFIETPPCKQILCMMSPARPAVPQVAQPAKKALKQAVCKYEMLNWGLCPMRVPIGMQMTKNLPQPLSLWGDSQIKFAYPIEQVYKILGHPIQISG
jgi:hypothetical protein